MQQGLDPRRKEHTAALRAALMTRRSATRAQLAEDTGLSTMTVGKLIAAMQARGEVRQDGSKPGTGGRPALVASYHADYAHYAALNVAQCTQGSRFVFTVYNLLEEPVFSRTQVMGSVRQDSFDAFFEEAEARGLNLMLAAFAFPGEADRDFLFISDFEQLMYNRFLPRIRQRFGVETLFENDVNAAVFGYAAETEGQEVCAGMYFPRVYCPGAGMVVRGEILHGCRHFAGEIAALAGNALDYSDKAQVLDRIEPLLTAYACVAAPQSMVLYGDFLTHDIQQELASRVSRRLCGQYAGQITCRMEILPDMQRGIARLAHRRVLTLLGAKD